MREALQRLRREESGFGIIEVIVAMMIMAIVLMSLAPFLVSSFKTTARNVRIAAATELVNQRIDLAQSRSYSSSCEAFETFLADYALVENDKNVVVDDKRKITYVLKYAATDDKGVKFSAASCKAAEQSDTGAESYFLRVEVRDSKDTVLLASAKTWIAVPGFGS